MAASNPAAPASAGSVQTQGLKRSAQAAFEGQSRQTNLRGATPRYEHFSLL